MLHEPVARYLHKYIDKSMKLNIFKTLVLGVLTMGFVACEKDYNKADYDAPLVVPTNLPEVTTGEVELYGVLANITCEMTPVEGANPTNWGLLLSDSKTLSLTGSQMYEGKITETSATFAISGLKENSKYYYCSFVSDGYNVAYGDTLEFETGKTWEVKKTTYDFESKEDADNYLPYRVVLDATQEEVYGPTTVGMLHNYGLGGYVVVCAILDPIAFYERLEANLVTYGVMNAAGFKADFTGSLFPAVTVDVLSNSLFFTGGAAAIGHFDVYVSNEPIENLEGLANAKKIGSSKDGGTEQKLYIANGDAGDPTIHTPMTFSVPKDYWGECYVYIVNKSDYDGTVYGEVNYGIAIRGYAIETTSPPAEETPEEVTPEETPEEV